MTPTTPSKAEAYETFRAAELESKRLREIAHTELSRYRECQRCLERMKEKILRQESRINAVVRPLQNPDEHPAIQHQSDPKAIEELLANNSDLRRFYSYKVAYATKRLYTVEKLIEDSDLSDIQETIIDMLYIAGDRVPTRRDVAKSTSYGKSQFYEILNTALEKIGKRADTTGHCSDVK